MMDLARYDSLNEKLRICLTSLREDDLTIDERDEILQEAHHLRHDMAMLLFS